VARLAPAERAENQVRPRLRDELGSVLLPRWVVAGEAERAAAERGDVADGGHSRERAEAHGVEPEQAGAEAGQIVVGGRSEPPVFRDGADGPTRGRPFIVHDNSLVAVVRGQGNVGYLIMHKQCQCKRYK